MKRRRLIRTQDDSMGVLDISSLVDICFLLLIYFIVTSVIMPREADIPTGLGGPQYTDQLTEVDPLWISIDSSGQIFTNEGNQKVPLDADPGVRAVPLLEDRLRLYRQGTEAQGQTCMVVIDAHDEVRTQRVVDVLNALAGLEIRHVSFHESAEE